MTARNDRAEHEEAVQPCVDEEPHGVQRIERQQHRGLADDPATPSTAMHDEPDAHDRPEQRADAARAALLDQEQADRG